MVRVNLLENPRIAECKRRLRQAYRDTQAPLWRAVEEYLEKSRSNRPEVNLRDLEAHTVEGALVVVPGKVLGAGQLSHRVIVGALAYSRSAAAKIKAAGGEALSLEEFVEKYKGSKGVVLLGG